jgi:hypothetical protein
MVMLRVKAVETMSTLEKVFPLTCFDVMTHLLIHLVEELDLCGLVHTMDVFDGEVHESLKRLCLKYGTGRIVATLL